MIADNTVARALSVLRSGPIFELPQAVKSGPFSFLGFITAGAVTPVDLRQAASRQDSQLDQIAAGNNPGITMVITAITLRYNESTSPANPEQMFNLLPVVELRHDKQGVTRFIQLGMYSSSQQSGAATTAAGTTFSGAPQRGPRMLSVPLVVDLEHDATFSIQPRTPIALAANMNFIVQFWGIAFPNSLVLRPDDCLDDASAVQIGKTGAAMDSVLTPAFNPDAYR